jgi:hypothetical protein
MHLQWFTRLVDLIRVQENSICEHFSQRGIYIAPRHERPHEFDYSCNQTTIPAHG